MKYPIKCPMTSSNKRKMGTYQNEMGSEINFWELGTLHFSNGEWICFFKGFWAALVPRTQELYEKPLNNINNVIKICLNINNKIWIYSFMIIYWNIFINVKQIIKSMTFNLQHYFNVTKYAVLLTCFSMFRPLNMSYVIKFSQLFSLFELLWTLLCLSIHKLGRIFFMSLPLTLPIILHQFILYDYDALKNNVNSGPEVAWLYVIISFLLDDTQCGYIYLEYNKNKIILIGNMWKPSLENT